MFNNQDVTLASRCLAVMEKKCYLIKQKQQRASYLFERGKSQ